MSFKPNDKTFAEGLDRIKKVCDQLGLKTIDKIITSKDSMVKDALKELEVTNIPDGFVKFQLPVAFDGPTQTYMSFGAPRAQVKTHSHDEGDGIRVIMFGSIIYNNQELTSGDWMFIPKGVPYNFEVGDMGVGVFYCYRCCCA